MSTSPKQYSVPWWANFFHSFPHFNFTFREVSSKFQPEDGSYQEALIAWTAIPVLVLVVSLIFFLVFFCCRCCRRSHRDRKPSRGTCFSWTIGVFIGISCAAVALGFYGNEDVSKGVVKLTTAAESVDDSVSNIQDHVYDLEKQLRSIITVKVKDLKIVLNSAVINSTVRPVIDDYLDKVEEKTSEAIKAIDNADNPVKNVTLKKYIKYVQTGDHYRWIGTIVVCSWTLAVCLLWFIAIGKASKGLLFMCAVLGMLTLTFSWTAAGIHSGASVGIGDFCVDPNGFIKEEAAKQNLMERAVLEYYMACNGTAAPFNKGIEAGRSELHAVNDMVTMINEIALPFVGKSKLAPIIKELTDGLTTSISLLSEISVLVQCLNIHREYVDALDGVCYMGLGGIAFMLIGFVVLGITFLTMLVLAPLAWSRMGRRRRFVEVDEDDPFLPRPGGNSSAATNNSPGYYRYGSVSNRESYVSPVSNRGSYVNPGQTIFSEPGGDPAPLGRRTPPPAYGEHSGNRTLGDRNTFNRSSEVF